jgi:hypothetical protein
LEWGGVGVFDPVGRDIEQSHPVRGVEKLLGGGETNA